MAEALNRLYRCGICGVTSPDINELKLHMIDSHIKGGDDNGLGHGETSEIELPGLSDGPDASSNQCEASENNENGELRNIASHGAQAGSPSDRPSSPSEPLTDNNSTEIDLNFKVKMAKLEMAMFPKHIKPALFFTCTYCNYKHQSFKQVSVHISDNHPKKLEHKLRDKKIVTSSRVGNKQTNPSSTSQPWMIQTSKHILIMHKHSMKKAKNLLSKSQNKATIQRAEKSGRAFSCAQCNMKCDKEIILNIHKRCHIEGSNKLHCCFCGKEAPTVKAWYGLFIHMVNKHPSEIPAPLSCDVCKKGFVKEFDLQKHLVCHSMDKPFSCDICGYAFKYKKNLRDHGILKHRLGTEEERLTLIKKIRSRAKPRNDNSLPWIKCSVCAYKTKIKSKFNIHSKIHNGIKDINCEYCEYTTGDRSALRRHEWRHRAVKPFACRFCEFSCIQRPQIISHYKNKHNLQSSDAAKIIQHINGSRRYPSDLDDVDQESADISQIMSVVTENHGLTMEQMEAAVVAESHEITIQQMEAGGNHGIPMHHMEACGVPGNHEIIIQHMDSSGETPVDLNLLTEAAEGLLAASQIELHTT